MCRYQILTRRRYWTTLLMSVIVIAFRTVQVSSQLEVIGAGFSRTGTNSLYLALNELGYKTHHVIEIIEGGREQDLELLQQKYAGKLSWQDIVYEVFEKDGYTAALDTTVSASWLELAEVYPDAKFILTERDSPQVWWESAKNTVIEPALFPIIKHISPLFRKMNSFGAAVTSHILQRPAHEPRKMWSKTDEEAILQAYQRNSQQAREFQEKYPDRMLIYNVKQGWGPLCEFLGKPMPPNNKPFPYVNTRFEFHKLFVGILTAIIVPPILLVWLLVWCLSRYNRKKDAKSEKDNKKKKS